MSNNDYTNDDIDDENHDHFYHFHHHHCQEKALVGKIFGM